MKKYIYVKFKEDYAGHKADEVVRVSKIPQHMAEFVTETTKNVFDKYVKEQSEAKRTEAKTKQVVDNSNANVAGVNQPSAGEVSEKMDTKIKK